jgi:succinate dehydrogenase / fumarate reductase membrane anchor subunit
MRTPLAEVRGLGSGKSGTREFIFQRVTALALVPLLGVFLVTLVVLVGKPHERVVEALASPAIAIILVAGILLTTVHMRIGAQVIIEDYVHAELAKVALLVANWVVAWGTGLSATFAVLKIALGS